MNSFIVPVLSVTSTGYFLLLVLALVLIWLLIHFGLKDPTPSPVVSFDTQEGIHEGERQHCEIVNRIYAEYQASGWAERGLSNTRRFTKVIQWRPNGARGVSLPSVWVRLPRRGNMVVIETSSTRPKDESVKFALQLAHAFHVMKHEARVELGAIPPTQEELDFPKTIALAPQISDDSVPVT